MARWSVLRENVEVAAAETAETQVTEEAMNVKT